MSEFQTSMRRQDEIRLVFPALDAPCQKLLLADVDAYASAFDAEDTHDFLWPLVAHRNDVVRHQALVSLSLFLPRFVASRMGAAGPRAGPWSSFLKERGAAGGPVLDAAGLAARDRLRAAAAGALAPLARRVAERLSTLAGPVCDVAKLALGWLGSDAALDALAADIRERRGGFESLWAFAHGGGARRDAGEVEGLLERHGWRRPDVLLAALPLPIAAQRRLAGRLRGKLDWLGTANLALALGRSGEGDAALDLAPLLDDASSWAQAFVLRALALSRQASALPLVRRVHAGTRHAFLKQQALRAAGSIPAPEAVEFCAEQARTAAGAEAAQALESLVMLKCAPDVLARAARPHLDSADLRARVNALLAAGDGASAWPASFVELAQSADPLARVEAAFCLGYWPSGRALRALAQMATADPHPAVRQQAIKSLSKYPTAQAVPLLTRLVETAPPPEAQAALRVLASAGADAAGPVAELFAREIQGERGAARRPMLIRALGAHAARTGEEAGRELIAGALSGGDRAAMLAALEALKSLPEQVDGATLAAVDARAADPDPEVWGTALVTLFLAGDLKAVDRLADHVAAGEPARASRAVLAFSELVLLANEVVGLGHERLSRALSAAEAPPTGRFVPVPAGHPGAPVLDEGEFRQAPPPPPAEEGLATEILAPEKKEKRAEIAALLAKSNYIAVVGAGSTAMDDQAPGARARVAARQLALLTRQSPLVVAPLALLILVGGAVLRAALASRPPPHKEARTALIVVSVRGRASAGDALLAAGDAVRAGQDVKLAPAAAVGLATDGGDRISASEEARLAADLDLATGGVRVALAEGRLDVEVRPGRTVRVEWLDHAVQCDPGHTAFAAQGGRLAVTLKDGAARLVRPGLPASELVPGREVVVP